MNAFLFNCWKKKEMVMNPQLQSFGLDSHYAETHLQERSCTPAADASLPADIVLLERVHEQGDVLIAPVFVP
jgi:hypothetical protein